MYIDIDIDIDIWMYNISTLTPCSSPARPRPGTPTRCSRKGRWSKIFSGRRSRKITRATTPRSVLRGLFFPRQIPDVLRCFYFRDNVFLMFIFFLFFFVFRLKSCVGWGETNMDVFNHGNWHVRKLLGCHWPEKKQRFLGLKIAGFNGCLMMFGCFEKLKVSQSILEYLVFRQTQIPAWKSC